jgi:hypothetical protein
METYTITASTSTKAGPYPKRTDELCMDYRNGLNGCVKKLKMGEDALLKDSDLQNDVTETGKPVKKGRVSKINNLINKIHDSGDTIGSQGVSPVREKQIDEIIDILGIKKDMTSTAQAKLQNIHDHCKDFVSIKLGEIDIDMDQVKKEIEKNRRYS